MATATRQRHTSQPIARCWDIAKDMDDNQKLELIEMLAESMKPKAGRRQEAEGEDCSPKPYTMDEVNAMLDAAEAEMAAGYGIPDEEVWRELEEEFAKTDAEEDNGQHTAAHREAYQPEAI